MNVSIVGAGSHSRSIIALLNNVNILINGIYDNNYSEAEPEFIQNVKLIGKLNEIQKDEAIVLAIGDNKNRYKIYKENIDQIYESTICHTTSFVDESTKIGQSSLVFGHCFLNAEVHIGANCIINTNAIVEHESNVGNHCHISVGSVICGRVTIGDFVFIGASAVVKDKITICDNVVIGAGSTVIRDITAPGTYVGSPARKLK